MRKASKSEVWSMHYSGTTLDLVIKDMEVDISK